MSDRITIKQAAEILDCHPNSIRNWAKAGVLTDVRIPGTKLTRISRSEVEHLAAARNTPELPATEAAKPKTDQLHCPTCTCGCTCGWGGQHDPDNPRCDLNA